MAKPTSKKKTATEAVVAKQRTIQRGIEVADAAEKKSKRTSARKKSESKPVVQAGSRRQPQNPMPKQHLKKPGNEFELDLQPRFLAPDYIGSGKLDGMTAIVTAAIPASACGGGAVRARRRRHRRALFERARGREGDQRLVERRRCAAS